MNWEFLIYFLCWNLFIEWVGFKFFIILKNKNCLYFLLISKLVDVIKVDGKIFDIISLMFVIYIKYLIVYFYSCFVLFYVFGIVYNIVKFGKLIKISLGFGYLNFFKVEIFLWCYILIN